MNYRFTVPIVTTLLAMNLLAADKDGEPSNSASPPHLMITKDTIQAYFSALTEKKNWDAFLADNLEFTSFTSPIRQTKGRDAYLQATKRFYSMITSVRVNKLIVEGDSACAFTHYELQPPNGAAFTSDVAELFVVKEGKIASLGIYFDTAPFPK